MAPISSPSPDNAPAKRILLAGAYANGNLGDHYQAASLARHLRAALPNADIHAASESKDDQHFEFSQPDNVARRGALIDPDYLKTFDAILIGGGGLLAAPHQPFCDTDWLASAKAPIHLIAVGATPEGVAQHEALLQRAVTVTARDEKSLDAVAAIRPDAALLHDPILADPTLDAAPRAHGAKPGEERVAIIMRKADNENARLYQILPESLQERDFAITIFPEADRKSGAIDAFQRLRVIEAWTMFYFVRALDAADYVFSERYHGCILALKRGLPCLGLGQAPGGKIGEFYRQIGHEGLVVDGDDRISRDIFLQRLRDAFDADRVRRTIDQMERDFAAQFAAIAARF